MPPVVAIIGKKNAGKTTLIEKLIPALVGLGYRVGTIKHHHGDIEMDIPGKDSWRHKEAGAHTVVLSSPTGLGLIHDTDDEVPLPELVKRFFTDVDLVFAEGYKNEELPKIEVFRSTVHAEPLADPGAYLIAMVSDIEVSSEVPCFALEETGPLAEFLVEKVLQQTTS